MKLHELSPVAGSTQVGKRIVASETYGRGGVRPRAINCYGGQFATGCLINCFGCHLLQGAEPILCLCLCRDCHNGYNHNQNLLHIKFFIGYFALRYANIAKKVGDIAFL